MLKPILSILHLSFIVSFLSSSMVACADRPLPASPTFEIRFHEEVVVDKNLVKLSDIVTITGSPNVAERLGELPFGPAPAIGTSQRWTQRDVREQLTLRGFDDTSFRFSGSQYCTVKSKASQPTPQTKTKFVPSVRNSNVIIQAERNVVDSIKSYLTIKTGESPDWTITVKLSPESADDLYQRRSIQGVAGGLAPWTGHQKFTLLIKNRDGESTVDVAAEIQLPPLVIASVGPIRREQQISASDLKLIPMPRNSRAETNECYQSIEELVGREAVRAISTGQLLTRANTRPMRVVDRGDLIEVEIVSGGIVVQTSGRALQPGGIDELITVEVLPQNKRLSGRVTGRGRVQLLSTGFNR